MSCRYRIIYADRGISGTSLKHRDEFNRMIEDCKAGKIDLIITKAVTRFARNVLDCISTIRMLKQLEHTVPSATYKVSIYAIGKV